MIGAYASIYNLGHRYASELLLDPVLVEEKVDGSQFSFMLGLDGELHCRSKSKELILDAPDKMFIKAVETVMELKPLLTPGWIYRGEYLQKPKHNTLAYDRVPNKHIVLFDIAKGEENYLDAFDKQGEAIRLGLEVVPTLYEGMIKDAQEVFAFLERPSFLGGQKIEGVVIKNYQRFGLDKKVLMGKFVSEAFKEVHRGEWKKANPGRGDVVEHIISAYKTPSRWNKAIQHLKEDGKLESSPKDIGALIKEVQRDVAMEGAEDIKDRLFDWAIKQVLRGVVAGLPEWYKEQLVKQQFEPADET